MIQARKTVSPSRFRKAILLGVLAIIAADIDLNGGCRCGYGPRVSALTTVQAPPVERATGL